MNELSESELQKVKIDVMNHCADYKLSGIHGYERAKRYIRNNYKLSSGDYESIINAVTKYLRV